MTRKKKGYASVQQPIIEAMAAGGMFRFPTEEQAKERLNSLREGFILSKQQPEENPESAIVLWVKGFELTDQEIKDGYIGNYALIAIAKTDDGKFYTINTTKLDSELKYHPQRKRVKHRHPNWGHPILRGIKKGRVYETPEEVNDELQRLHEEYPDISIPCPGKLYIIIYTREKMPPAQKYVLTPKIREEGGFIIECEENTYEAPPIPAKKAPEEAPQGYFTSMVALRRKRKPPAAAAGKTEKTEDGGEEPAE